MTFTATVKNLGKIAGAPITVGGLTVLAGPNATGKSFFSKMLYSVFEAVNANHALTHIQWLIEPMQLAVAEIEATYQVPDSVDTFDDRLHEIERLCAQIRADNDEFKATGEIHEKLVSIGARMIALYQDFRPFLEEMIEVDDCDFDSVSFKSFEAGIRRLQELVNSGPEEIVFNGFRRGVQQNLHGNFQARSLAELQGDPARETLVEIKGLGKISIAGNALNVKVSPSGFTRMRRYSRVIYLESPVYWKVRGALNAARDASSRRRNGSMNLDIPKYIHDLDVALGQKYSGEGAFPEVLDRLTGKDIMAGKVTLGESGALAFSDLDNSAQRSFSMPSTATGAINLGVLALLIEKRIIDKGAFLFIDEPESNLHPKWQAEMIETLLELAKGGVYVVIATHSADIVERLLALAKKHPKMEKLIALNHFSREGVKNGGLEFREKIGEILKELTDAYSDSYMMSKGLK